VGSADVNDYLKSITGQSFTAKDFRTWAGTVLAAMALSAFEQFDSQTHAKKNVRAAIEEVAARADVSMPVVYEHFGGKEGLYAVVVDREIAALLNGITGALSADLSSRETLERAAMALLEYIETSTDGFRILVRDSPTGQATGSFASLISDVASQVEHILAAEFKRRKLDPKAAPLYAQMLVGMVALTGQWWLDSRKMKKADVAAHLVNLAWNGLAGLEKKPTLRSAS
jgi:AcrR family transcriptional regulator